LAYRTMLHALIALSAVANNPIVTLPQGQAQGFTGCPQAESPLCTTAYRGLPYAAAPVGDLRFKAPQPPSSWAAGKVWDATKFGASCEQMGSPGIGGRAKSGAWPTLNLTTSSEDCLFANVYVPAGTKSDATLPVMVYMHAGEFRFGASNDQENNWPYLANGAVILVTFNVRLGLFGFAALDQLRKEDPTGTSGNYGMMDQRAALQWVQKSIASFGGDPAKVTIFGESSGGTSVAYHVVNPKSAGLFKRAILESPGLTQSKPWSHAEENTQFAAAALTAAQSTNCTWPANKAVEWLSYPGMEVGGSPMLFWKNAATAREVCQGLKGCFLIQIKNNSLVELFGKGTPGDLSSNSEVAMFNASAHGSPAATTVEFMKSNPDTIVDCLRAASSADLVGLNLAPPWGDTFQTDTSAPAIDGVELPAPVQVLSRTHVPAGIDLLGGSNLDEGTEFMSLCPPISCNASDAEFEEWSVKQFGEGLGPKVLSVYGPSNIERPAPVCRSYGRNQLPTSDSWLAAMRSAGDAAILCRTREMLRAAQKLGSAGYWYYFVATPIKSYNMGDIPSMGAFHGAEVPFVFGYPNELSSDGERTLSKTMGCYWTNFAETGNPNNGACSSVNGEPLLNWPVSGVTAGDAIVFSNTTITTRSGLKQDQCDLFMQYP